MTGFLRRKIHKTCQVWDDLWNEGDVYLYSFNPGSFCSSWNYLWDPWPISTAPYDFTCTNGILPSVTFFFDITLTFFEQQFPGQCTFKMSSDYYLNANCLDIVEGVIKNGLETGKKIFTVWLVHGWKSGPYTFAEIKDDYLKRYKDTDIQVLVASVDWSYGAQRSHVFGKSWNFGNNDSEPNQIYKDIISENPLG